MTKARFAKISGIIRFNDYPSEREYDHKQMMVGKGRHDDCSDTST